ncbi:hypothetical protein DRO64_10355 [Candidatus Bathyarchaeota archaeon]|nr:MAG: hypothetical protein DRO64_10355 [Candidatus Bathyarchaeota archaeon]
MPALRVAVLDRDKCDPKKCGSQPCIRFCPPVRNEIEAIKLGEDGYPVIVEPLCIGWVMRRQVPLQGHNHSEPSAGA